MRESFFLVFFSFLSTFRVLNGAHMNSKLELMQCLFFDEHHHLQFELFSLDIE